MHKNDTPKISVITPSYNQGQFIEKTIQSVLGQNYPNLEYIIIDGGSTDDSVSIIKKYEKHLSYWVSEKDRGQSHAINKGFSKATGDIYYWINSDDYLLPGALELIGNYHWLDNLGAVVGIGHKVNLNNEIIYTPEYYEHINTEKLFQWTNKKNFMQPACFFTQEAWIECGPLNEELFFCMDVDLWIKISKQFKIDRIKKELAHAYVHEHAKTTSDVDRMFLETYLLIAYHGGLKESKERLFNLYEQILNRDVGLKNMFRIRFKKMIKNFLK